MCELVPPEKQALEPERREQMIEASYPLRHSVVEAVLCFERELEKAPGHQRAQVALLSGQPAIRTDPEQSRVAVGDQPQGYVVVHEGGRRRSVQRPEQIVVEIRGPQRQLCLLQGEETVMVPWGLAEQGEREWMPLNEARICRVRDVDIGQNVSTEETRRGLVGLERSHPTEHLAPIVPGHPDGSDLRGRLVEVEIGGVHHTRAAVGQVHGAACVVRKARQELGAQRDDLVRLTTGTREAARDDDVLGVAKHAAEGIARQRPGGGLRPRHDHPGIQAPGQGHPDTVVASEVPGQVAGKYLADLFVEALGFGRFLFFPRRRLKVRPFFLAHAAPKDPRRRRW